MKDNKALRVGLITSGILLILLGVVILVMSMVESFGGAKGKMNIVDVPGFHELDLKEPGLYGGVYQHRRKGPMPIEALTKMNVQILSKYTYEQIPVVMNTTGQTFDQFGLKGMPVFNFVIEEPGPYTLNAFTTAETIDSTFPILILSQSTQNIRQILIVGGLCFIVFLTLGIVLLVNVKKWAPKT